MGLILIIIGVILTALFGIIYISSHAAIKNQKNWDDFYKYAQEQNNMISNYPEEMLYKIICKLNLVSCILFCVGLILTVGGIILVAMA